MEQLSFSVVSSGLQTKCNDYTMPYNPVYFNISNTLYYVQDMTVLQCCVSFT